MRHHPRPQPTGPSFAGWAGLVVVVAVVSPLWSAPEGATGRWEGTVQIPGREIGVVIDLVQDSQGALTGSATVPGFGIKGAPLAAVVTQDREVAFTIKGALGDPRFEGRLEEKGTLAGRFLQAGNTAPFELRRIGPPEVEPIPQSTSVSHAFEGEWRGETELGGNQVRARLTLANRTAGPAVVHFYVVGQKEHDLPVDLVTEENGFLTVRSPDLGGVRYEGQLRPETREIVGTLTQGSFEGSLVLRPNATTTQGHP
jgi:hypothetical protein